MVKFYAEPEVWDRLSDKEIPKNGCGAGSTAWLIPNKWFGLDFTIPCGIHDEMYALGKTQEDKIIADRVFYNNMLRAVEARPWYLQPLGRRLALRYFQAVDQFGAVSFWEGKNKPDEMRTAKTEAAINGGLKLIKVVT